MSFTTAIIYPLTALQAGRSRGSIPDVPGVDSASNRNEYQEYFLGVKAAGA
jgi:hypothetical protein